MLQETLKQATGTNHHKLEQLMYVNDIMSGSLTTEQYKQILATNYIVHKNYEEAIFGLLSPGLAAELDLPKRNKLAALQKDMDELQVNLQPTEADKSIFTANNAELLGAMYVLEGATLGGSVIVKKLKTDPKFAGLGLHYYQVYGERMIPLWKKFCEVLNQQPESSYHAAVQGAKKMFGYIAAVQQQQRQLA
jgi:heme oxygenase